MPVSLLSLLKGIWAFSSHDYFMPQIPRSILAYKFQTHTQTTEIFLLSRKHPAVKTCLSNITLLVCIPDRLHSPHTNLSI